MAAASKSPRSKPKPLASPNSAGPRGLSKNVDAVDEFMKNGAFFSKIKCPDCGSWPNDQGVCTHCKKLSNLRSNLEKDPSKPNVYQPPKLDDVALTDKAKVKCEKCGAWKKVAGDCSHCSRFLNIAGIKRRNSNHGKPNVYIPPNLADVATTDRSKREKCVDCGSWKTVNVNCSLCSRIQKNRPTLDPNSPGVYVPVPLKDVKEEDQMNAKSARKKCGNCGCYEKNGICAHCARREKVILAQQKEEHTYYSAKPAVDMRVRDGAKMRVKCDDCGVWKPTGGECKRCGPRLAAAALLVS